MSTDPREFEHPIDGTGGTVPPLVDVIAGVLAGHQMQIESDEGDHMSPPEEAYSCSCGQEHGGWVASGADWEWPDWTKDHAAHQARAVLAAISEAGLAGGDRYYAGSVRARIREAL